MLHEMPIITLPFAGEIYNLYVASSEEEKRQGLSGVDHIGRDEGMIFDYDDEKPRTFQFRDVCFPLAVYFIGANGKVLQKSTSSPYQAGLISCEKPCKWVIEIPVL